MTPEGRTKAKLKAYLLERDAYAFWPVQTGYGASTVDCIVCDRGKFVGIECKREGVEEPSARQKIAMKQMRRAGAITWLVTLDEAGELKWIKIDD